MFPNGCGRLRGVARSCGNPISGWVICAHVGKKWPRSVADGCGGFRGVAKVQFPEYWNYFPTFCNKCTRSASGGFGELRAPFFGQGDLCSDRKTVAPIGRGWLRKVPDGRGGLRKSNFRDTEFAFRSSRKAAQMDFRKLRGVSNDEYRIAQFKLQSVKIVPEWMWTVARSCDELRESDFGLGNLIPGRQKVTPMGFGCLRVVSGGCDGACDALRRSNSGNMEPPPTGRR